MKVDVRFAKDTDGARIGELARACDFNVPDVDWSRVEPYWLVAETDENVVVAAIQLLVGYPISRIDFMFIDPSLPKLRRGESVTKLKDYALALAQQFGAQLVASSIDVNLESYRKVAEKRGWVVGGTSWNVLRRIR